MSDKTITIPAPVVLPDELCEVLNYRRKHGDIWEQGRCISAKYSYNYSSWGYEVILIRRGKSGDPIRLYANDEGIRAMEDAK